MKITMLLSAIAGLPVTITMGVACGVSSVIRIAIVITVRIIIVGTVRIGTPSLGMIRVTGPARIRTWTMHHIVWCGTRAPHLAIRKANSRHWSRA